MKQLQADNPPVQRVALVKPAQFMQRRASVYAAQFKIRIQQRAHDGSLYIRRVL
jgi:hypothetical protein